MDTAVVCRTVRRQGALIAAQGPALVAMSAAAIPPVIRDTVLRHRAFVGGSSWLAVTAMQNPLTSPRDDVVVLVGIREAVRS